MSTQKSKWKLKFNITKKKKEITENKYNLMYKNTPYIPKSSIIKYLISNFSLFQKNSENSENNEDLMTFQNIFDIKDDFQYKDEILNIKKINLMSTKDFSLEKFISYAFYLTSSTTFESITLQNNKQIKELRKTNSIINQLKDQIGKDVSRISIFINNQQIPKKNFQDLLTDQKQLKITDQFYDIIISYFNKFKLPINFNYINTIALLSCQNIVNIIGDLVTIYVKNITSEICAFFQPDKKIKITITENKIALNLLVSTKLMISKNLLLDPDNLCGRLSYNLEFDILNETYKFKSFILRINNQTCQPKEIRFYEGKDYSSIKSAIPAIISTAAVTSAPYILAAI